MTEINIYVTMTALKDNCTLNFSVFFPFLISNKFQLSITKFY